MRLHRKVWDVELHLELDVLAHVSLKYWEMMSKDLPLHIFQCLVPATGRGLLEHAEVHVDFSWELDTYVQVE